MRRSIEAVAAAVVVVVVVVVVVAVSPSVVTAVAVGYPSNPCLSSADEAYGKHRKVDLALVVSLARCYAHRFPGLATTELRLR